MTNTSNNSGAGKRFYAINAQIFGDDKLIRDIDVKWPGSTHDSKVWCKSEVKPYLEQQRCFLIAGDSAYPISEILIKPYTTAEAANDNRKNCLIAISRDFAV